MKHPRDIILLALMGAILALSLSSCGALPQSTAAGRNPVITARLSAPPAPPAAAKPINSDPGQKTASLESKTPGPDYQPKAQLKSTTAAQISLTAGWNTISFPLQSLASASGFTYCLYRFNGSGYEEINPLNSPEMIDCRLGYWAYADSDSVISLEGEPNTSLNRSNLNPGWNFLGCPFSSARSFSSLGMDCPGSSGFFTQTGGLDLTPGPDEWFYGRVYDYRNQGWNLQSSWLPDNQLQPGKGYWLWCWQSNASLNYGACLTALSPGAGVNPGDCVTLSGLWFGDHMQQVNFNGVPAQAYYSWSDTQIICAVPAGAASGPVTVILESCASNSLPGVIWGSWEGDID